MRAGLKLQTAQSPPPYAPEHGSSTKHILQYQQENVKHTIIKMCTLLQPSSRHNQHVVIPEAALSMQLLHQIFCS